MTTNGPSAAERLCYALKGLDGWYAALVAAEDSDRHPLHRGVGRVISSILLAAGEEAVPIFVWGAMNDDFTGNLLAVYDDMIVTVAANALAIDTGTHHARIWPLAEVSELTIEAGHSHYEGTEKRPRSSRLTVSFKLGGEPITLSANAHSFQSDLVQQPALFAAFQRLRASVIGA